MALGIAENAYGTSVALADAKRGSYAALEGELRLETVAGVALQAIDAGDHVAGEGFAARNDRVARQPIAVVALKVYAQA